MHWHNTLNLWNYNNYIYFTYMMSYKRISIDSRNQPLSIERYGHISVVYGDRFIIVFAGYRPNVHIYYYLYTITSILHFNSPLIIY